MKDAEIVQLKKPAVPSEAPVAVADTSYAQGEEAAPEPAAVVEAGSEPQPEPAPATAVVATVEDDWGAAHLARMRALLQQAQVGEPY